MNKIRKPILDVLQRKVPEHIPVWLMRQAGRYLPEYREIRSKSKNFLNMCLDSDIATEITLQPVRRFDMDAAILFADILLVPMAMGLSLDFREGEGPVLQSVDAPKIIDALDYDPKKVSAVFETVGRVKKQLPEKTALIGFCGAPWTIACYMIDGNSRFDFAKSKAWVKSRPGELCALIEKIVSASDEYLCSQIEAGAEVVQIFDSWAGLISGNAFEDYILKPTQNLIARVKAKHPNVPIIGFPRGAGNDYVPYAQKSGIDALSIDQNVDLFFAQRELQKFKPLQGNLDPALLVKGGKDMLEAMEKILRLLGPIHIANLGHGVVPETPYEHVEQLVDFIHGFRP